MMAMASGFYADKVELGEVRACAEIGMAVKKEIRSKFQIAMHYFKACYTFLAPR